MRLQITDDSNILVLSENEDMSRSSSNITGNLEEVSASRIKGWAYQTGKPNTPIDVHVYIKHNTTGAQTAFALTANQYRADLQAAGYGNGYHAFNYAMDWSAYRSGTYTVSVYGINGSNNPHIPNSPRTFTVRKATGTVDGISNTGVSGWAWKPDSPNNSIQVHLYIRLSNNETVYSFATIANTYRGDLYNAGYGDGEHGYFIPIDWSSLPKERLRVTLYAVDGSNENPAFYDVYHDKRLPIYHIGIIDNKGIDFSAWATQEIVNYSYNIGTPQVVKCIGVTGNNLLEYIHQSRFATVYTHGSQTSLTWSKNNTNNPQSGTITCDAINNNAGTCYFDNTECLLLMACEAAKNYTSIGSQNIAKTFKDCGAQTVVAFEGNVYSAAIDNEIINTEAAGLWAKIFVKKLGEGESITIAKNIAWVTMYQAQLEIEDKVEAEIEALLIADPEYVESRIYCGMNTCVILGNGNVVVKK